MESHILKVKKITFKSCSSSTSLVNDLLKRKPFFEEMRKKYFLLIKHWIIFYPKQSERSQSNAQNASIRKIQISSMQEQSLNPKLQEELNRFKEIQMNPQLLLQTLSKMEQERRQVSLNNFELWSVNSAVLSSGWTIEKNEESSIRWYERKWRIRRFCA